MSAFDIHDTVGDVVARRPALARVFERAGIDYRCGGRKTLAEACQEKDMDPATLIASLEEASSFRKSDRQIDTAAMSLSGLADHIEATHHVYLRAELPLLKAMTDKVASVHGEKDPRLKQVRDTLLGFAEELAAHMMKEEQILFPMVRQLEAGGSTSIFDGGSLAGPIGQMETEHEEAGAALERLRGLTGGYSPPEWACTTYRSMLEALARLESDMHQHIHKENNVLFPRALGLGAGRARG